jgi:pimeloyl-ACP methyl ester carboxylesterase
MHFRTDWRKLVVKILFAISAALAGLSFSEPSHAADIGAGTVMRVDTRAGIDVPLYTVWRSDAVATVILFSGGGGGFGKIGEDGWPASSNFLIRTGKLWAAHPFNVVMVGRPSDGIDLRDGAVRIGENHAADNRSIFKAVKLKSNLPIWVVGTSMGTMSAAAAAIQDNEKLVSGVVLTSSVTSYKRVGAVPTQDLARIRVPTLVVHHEKDACKICAPHEVSYITSGLKNAPIKKTVLVSGGSGQSGDPCEPMHYHGFVGMEKEAVDMIAAWIVHPAD